MGSEVDHTSVSQINEFIGCQQQFYLHRIAQEEPLDTSSYLVVGSAYHIVLESIYRGVRDGNPVDLKDMKLIFEQVITEDSQDKVINWGRSSFEKELATFDALAPKILESVDWESEVVSIEDMFRLEIPGVPVPVIGRTDLVLRNRNNGVITVIDFKTSSTKPSTSNDPLVPSDVDSNIQMTIYQMAMREQFPGDEIKLAMHFMIKSQRSPAYIMLSTSRSEEQEKEVEELARRVWGQMELMRAGAIEPLPQRGWRCSGCSYRHLCRLISSEEGLRDPSLLQVPA